MTAVSTQSRGVHGFQTLATLNDAEHIVGTRASLWFWFRFSSVFLRPCVCGGGYVFHCNVIFVVFPYALLLLSLAVRVAVPHCRVCGIQCGGVVVVVVVVGVAVWKMGTNDSARSTHVHAVLLVVVLLTRVDGNKNKQKL